MCAGLNVEIIARNHIFRNRGQSDFFSPSASIWDVVDKKTMGVETRDGKKYAIIFGKIRAPHQEKDIER